MVNDLRYAIRMLLKSPGFTIVAVLTLALGIGANTAIFSVINAVLLRPLPFKNPSRLVTVQSVLFIRGAPSPGPVSYPDFVDWRNQNHSLEQMAAFRTGDFVLGGVGEPAHLSGAVVSAELISLLGVRPSLGRPFLPEEDGPGGANGSDAVILSHDLWQRQFSADKNILGRTITLNNRSFTVVGVMPAGFQFPIQVEPVELWTTTAVDSTTSPGKDPETSDRGSYYLKVIARLKPGVSIAQAKAELDAIAVALEKQYPGSNANRGAVKVVPEREQLVGDIRPALLALFGAVGFVLLIACVNVANLLLVRATARQKEIAIRAALGASRVRVVRQSLTESVLLSSFGGGFGLLLGLWGKDLLVRLSSESIPRLTQVSLDGRVLGFTLLASMLTGLIFGLAPAQPVSQADLAELLKEGGRSSAESLRGKRLRRMLVVTELALALLLMVGAGLLIQSFVRLLKVNPGFDAHNVLTFNISLPDLKYSEEKRIDFYRQLLSRIRVLPGVRSEAAVSPLPLSGNGWGVTFQIQGHPTAINERPETAFRVIAPGYFNTMRIPVLKGREFNARDDAKTSSVIVINQTLASRFFPNRDPIGERIEAPLDGIIREVVGVVGDVKHESLRTEAGPEVYLPLAQRATTFMAVVVRTETDPKSIIASVRNEVRILDKDLPIFDVRTLEQYLGLSLTQFRFSTVLFCIFAGLALLLTGVGLYGVISYSVAQRTREIGIRVALGAQQDDVLRMVLSQGLRLVLVGMGIGLVAALALTRVLSSFLFGVTATDPATFMVVSALLVTVALLACYIPARRATKVDPMVALRYE